MYKQPSINSAKAMPYLPWHICQQDRIRKELYGGVPAELAEIFDKPRKEEGMSRSSSVPLVIHQERFPMGHPNRLANNSSALSRTLGPRSYDGSGGINTIYRHTHGPVFNFPDVGGPMGLRHNLISTRKERPSFG
eukprot:TRINITY_DN75170_c0_g1_i1.p1 TRINITY_DN75170_c0_g1~~TRINITY_DN75170_c0_g1_i1.p1  ORF type:complete len:155 (+),score=11.04 TRINITY_DN75170_c0_g1_i1:61-465(+)